MNPIRLPITKPRNPFVALSRRRSAGAHQRTASAMRQAGKRALRKDLEHRTEP